MTKKSLKSPMKTKIMKIKAWALLTLDNIKFRLAVMQARINNDERHTAPWDGGAL